MNTLMIHYSSSARLEDLRVDLGEVLIHTLMIHYSSFHFARLEDLRVDLGEMRLEVGGEPALVDHERLDDLAEVERLPRAQTSS